MPASREAGYVESIPLEPLRLSRGGLREGVGSGDDPQEDDPDESLNDESLNNPIASFSEQDQALAERDRLNRHPKSK